MKAAVYEQFGGPLAIRQVPDPVPREGEVVLRVKAAGLCRSDWHGWMGHDPDIRLPHVPGHELAGVIESIGPGVGRWNVGDRVTLPFVCGCGSCPECLSGNQQVCDRQFQPGFTAWGGFAEMVAIARADINLVRLPDELDFVAAASLGCRFVTAFRAVVDQGKVSAGQWVAVHGCGGVGLSAVMIAAASGAQVVGIDIRADQLALARAVGALHTVDASQEADLVARVIELTSGGAHISIDALGSPETCFNSIANLRKRGKHIQVGLMLAADRHPSIPMDKVIAHELEILGSHGMQAHRYGAMLAIIQSGKLAPDKLVGRTISLSEAAEELVALDRSSTAGMTIIDRFQE